MRVTNRSLPTLRLRELRDQLVLRNEQPPPPIEYCPALVIYAGTVATAAAVASALCWRPLIDPITLALGSVAVAAMAAFSIRTIGGESSAWSAAVFVTLGMSLALGPPGAIAAAVSNALIGGLLIASGWFRILFNLSTLILANLAAWVFGEVAITHVSGSVGIVFGGLGAGLALWVVNHVLVAGAVCLATRGTSFSRALRSGFDVLPYNLAYGWAAEGVRILYAQTGVLGFSMLILSAIAGQAFLVRLARTVQRHNDELRAAEEAERRRIARDLHDTVVQTVVGWSMSLAAETTVDRRTSGNEAALRERLGKASDDLRKAAQGLRTLILQIAPPSLHELGLRATLEQLLEPLRDAGVTAHCEFPESEPVNAKTAELMFRVAQEALRNVVAHAHADAVVVTVRREGPDLVLRISDDGRGFTAGDVERRRQQGHVGTRGLREEADTKGATLEIESQPGRGTRVTLTVPRP